MTRLRWLLALAFLLMGAAPLPAHASLRLCNRTSYIVYAATAAQTGSQIVTKGWTRVVPGDCEIAIDGDLVASGYYLYARSSIAHAGIARAWGGNVPLCGRDVNFNIASRLAAPCDAQDSFSMTFAPIDTHHMRSWTMTLTDSPSLPTMDAARLAGLKRLLKDNGLKVGPIDARPDKDAAASLGQFEARAHLPASETPTALFVMLENEAAKRVAPAGYTVCNDTKAPLVFAIGQKSGQNWISHGWWKVAAGSCAAATTTPLSTDKIYLFAQHPGGTAIVTGPNPFCVTNIEFDIQDRARCKARGLDTANFAETSTRGVAGYVAHVGDMGLLPPVTLQPRTSK